MCTSMSNDSNVYCLLLLIHYISRLFFYRTISLETNGNWQLYIRFLTFRTGPVNRRKDQRISPTALQPTWAMNVFSFVVVRLSSSKGVVRKSHRVLRNSIHGLAQWSKCYDKTGAFAQHLALLLQYTFDYICTLSVQDCASKVYGSCSSWIIPTSWG